MRLLVVAILLAVPACAQPSITISQPSGNGSFQWDVSGAGAGHELYNLVSFTQHTPSNMGPIFGLGLAGSEILLPQVLAPLGVDPFHVQADGSGCYTWSFTATPAGLVIDADFVTVEWNAGYVDRSSVVPMTINL